MPKKSDIELAQWANLKRLRSAVRLEASIRVDQILNQLEDDAKKEMDRRINAGEGVGALIAYHGWIEEAVASKFAPEQIEE